MLNASETGDDGVESAERTVMVASSVESTIALDGDALVRRCGHEVLRVEPWGRNSTRIRVSLGVEDDLGALLERPATEGEATLDDDEARLAVGELTVTLNVDGRLRFSRTSDDEELLREEPIHYWWPGARNFTVAGNGYYRIEQRFRAYPGERLFGLGQHQHGRLDQKGIVLDLVQRNREVTHPASSSPSRGYGFLWNSPAVGRVELGETGTRWVADSSRQIDYWVTVGSPAEIAAQLRRCDRPRAAAAGVGGRVLAVRSCATAHRRSCWRSPASTRSAGCRCR